MEKPKRRSADARPVYKSGGQNGGRTAQWYAPNSPERLTVAEVHQPSDAEQRHDEAAENVQAVIEPFAIYGG